MILSHRHLALLPWDVKFSLGLDCPKHLNVNYVNCSHPRCDCAVGPLKFIMSNLRPKRILVINSMIFLIFWLFDFISPLGRKIMTCKKKNLSKMLNGTSVTVQQGSTATWRTGTRQRSRTTSTAIAVVSLANRYLPSLRVGFCPIHPISMLLVSSK